MAHLACTRRSPLKKKKIHAVRLAEHVHMFIDTHSQATVNGLTLHSLIPVYIFQLRRRRPKFSLQAFSKLY